MQYHQPPYCRVGCFSFFEKKKLNAHLGKLWQYCEILFNVISPRYHFLLPEPLAESKDGTMCSFFSSSTDAQVTSLRSHWVCLFSVSVNCLFFLVRKDYAFMYDVILLKFCNPLTTEGWKTPKYHLCYGLYHQYLPVNNNLKIPTWFGFTRDLPNCCADQDPRGR